MIAVVCADEAVASDELHADALGCVQWKCAGDEVGFVGIDDVDGFACACKCSAFAFDDSIELGMDIANWVVPGVKDGEKERLDRFICGVVLDEL